MNYQHFNGRLVAAFDDRSPFRVKRLGLCALIGLAIAAKGYVHQRNEPGAAVAAAWAFGGVTVGAWLLIAACEWAGITRVERPDGTVTHHVNGGRLMAGVGGVLLLGVGAMVAVAWWHGAFDPPPPPVTSRHPRPADAAAAGMPAVRLPPVPQFRRPTDLPGGPATLPPGMRGGWRDRSTTRGPWPTPLP